MTINFIPNDPTVTLFPARKVAPRPERAGNRAGFAIVGALPAGVYVPGTAGFVQWQTRQAAILAVEAWEKVLARPLTRWAHETVDNHHLPLDPDAGDDVNAYYERSGLLFYHHVVNGTTTYSGASTDVVSHEVGHAVLDAMRPELWDANFSEVAAFHEAFGDVTALVTALADRHIRKGLLVATPDLGLPNPVESLAEDLADAVRFTYGADNPSSAPRHALNSFRWQLPDGLPRTAPPDVLCSEAHSLARVITGCFWDVLRALFVAGAGHDASALWRATRTAAQLFHQGAAGAVLGPRFFRAVGQATVRADDTATGGAHRQLVVQAFAGHGLALDASGALAPEHALAGAPLVRGAGHQPAALGPASARHLRRLIAAPPRAVLTTEALTGTDDAVSVGYRLPVALDRLDRRLAGGVAMADIRVVVGRSGARAAVLGALPQPESHVEAVLDFVRTLLANDQVQLPGAGRSPRGAAAARAGGRPPALVTHRLVRRGRATVLARVRFA